MVLVTLTACSHMSDTKNPAPQTKETRAQLAIGYSLLYQEADGIPKLKWLLMFKDKPEEMSRVTSDLIDYYQRLAETAKGDDDPTAPHSVEESAGGREGER